MANFFIIDAGQKFGPFDEQQLKALAAKGRITPTTPLEADSGYQGVAGQIPGLFSAAQAAPSAPKQLFCTNCGKPVSEQAIACMSCGAKPAGHRKFCRQCASALSPEQVVCTKCGTGVKGASNSPAQAGVATNLFCTNCGNSSVAQAVACMSCGAKPTGHKKFCRQCGVGLSPEQVVCVKCGTNIAAGSVMDGLSAVGQGAKRMAEQVVSASSVEKVKKVVPMLIWGAVAVAVLWAVYWVISMLPIPDFSNAGPLGHLRAALKKAKSGDQVIYDVTTRDNMAMEEKATVTFEVLSNDSKSKKVSLRVTTRQANRPQGPTFPQRPTRMSEPDFEMNDIEIDLSKPDEELIKLMMEQMPGNIDANMRNASIKIEGNKNTTKEKLLVAGKEFNCIVKSSNVITTTGSITVTVPVKEWTSKDVPVTGSVKSEVRVTTPSPIGERTVTITQTLTSFTKK